MDKNGHDGQNGQEWTAEWTMDNGREWTMDNGQRLCRTLRADSNIADPSDPSEKPIGQITNSRAISSVEAATLQIFRAFRAFRGQK
jgi:hypothetical protein